MKTKHFIALFGGGIFAWTLLVAAIENELDKEFEELQHGITELTEEVTAVQQEIGQHLKESQTKIEGLYEMAICAHAREEAVKQGTLKKNWRLSEIATAEFYAQLKDSEPSFNCTTFLQQNTIPSSECAYQFEQAVNEGRVAALKLSALRESGDPLDVSLTAEQNAVLEEHPYVENSTLHCAQYITKEALASHSAHKCYPVTGKEGEERFVRLNEDEIRAYGSHPNIKDGKLDCNAFVNSL